MFRIDDPSAVASLPPPEAAGAEGYFTEGNPGSGIPATLVRGSFLNMLQEELRAVVVAGGLTPSKTAYNQVLTAIQNMINGLAIGVNQTWQNVTVSRALNTTYTNTTGRPIAVNALATLGTANFNTVLRIAGQPSVIGSGNSWSGAPASSVFGIVPPGATYALELSGGAAGALSNWFELR